MQNIPGGRSSSGGRAGSTSHTVPTTQETQIAPTSVGHQSSDLDAYFNLDPTAAFPFIDPVNQTLIGYSTAAIPSHVIMNQHPNQPAHSLIAYQPRVEIQEQLLPNLHPMASCEAAGPPALNYGTYGGYSLGGQNRATLRCKWEGCAYSGTFNRREDLLRHVRNLHVTPQSYLCEICGRRFNQSYNRAVHMRVHRMRGVSRG
ncbi:hypothetical protein M752DRAFT_276276 [Aspergillus phoenicis ATCC 13157]|uniref:C2H2-type domain-containing protein n=1 Tax=Aspergillus phoenicis ATCC 13157 TaxID=1353007 RepID=A0A370PJC6_ASPPH|nr:hypothetical protein M752DRAFT_276276 [Aspergillus phoenicis ATCC 13157]